jgi:hypothetical protein
MHRVVGLLVAVACTGIGCGDGANPTPLTDEQLVRRLRELPGVTVEVGEFPEDDLDLALQFRYYVLRFTQLVDHTDASQGTFQQQVRLLHRNELAPSPMIVYTAGYADRWGYKPHELTNMLAANQISIEHRYYGTSRPAVIDWSKLTIKQMAADEHEIITALRSIYGGAFLSTGGSKGGMTAVFHRRFYPDDVDGTVAYVTPLSLATSDRFYQDKLDEMSATECRQAVRRTAINMLAQHRGALVERAGAQPDHTYTRVLLEPAVEAAIASVEWSFWQYLGISQCPIVPAQDATVDNLFAFLEQVSPVGDYDDDSVAFYEAYVYQSHTQLGYPSEEPSYLEDLKLLTFGAADYAGELPIDDDDRDEGDHPSGPGHRGPSMPVEVRFDPKAMEDVAEFVREHGDRLLFIYGGGDPWSARPFELGSATRSAMFVEPDGTHRSQIRSLASEDRNEALRMIEDWTGVAPTSPTRKRSTTTLEVDDPSLRRMPARVRALRAEK